MLRVCDQCHTRSGDDASSYSPCCCVTIRPYSLVGSTVPVVVVVDSSFASLARRCFRTMNAINAITSNKARIPPIIPPIIAPSLLEFGVSVIGTAAIVLPLTVGSASISVVMLLIDGGSVVELLSSNVELCVFELEAVIAFVLAIVVEIVAQGTGRGLQLQGDGSCSGLQYYTIQPLALKMSHS